jgi:L-iditol 2-dehydrogenase
MKAAVFLGPGKMEVRDVPTPSPAPGEVLVKVLACAVCGTDLRIFQFGHHAITPPHITGHEICGVVEKLGVGVDGPPPGTKCVLVTSYGCGTCRFCRVGRSNLCSVNWRAIGYQSPGGFAQYLSVPAPAVAQGAVLPIADSVDAAQATLVEPLSCVFNGQEFLRIGPGDSVLIFGAGPIGVMHGLLAKAMGAGCVMISELRPERLNAARKFGFTAYIGAEDDAEKAVMKYTDGEGPDVAITACPSGEAQMLALKLVAAGGRVSLFGGLPKDHSSIQFDSNKVHYKEVGVFGAFASNSIQYLKCMKLIASGVVDVSALVTHKFKLDRILEAFETARASDALKVVVLP